MSRNKSGASSDYSRPFDSSSIRATSEKELQGVLELSPDALILVDQEGHIVRANTQASVFFGYSTHALHKLLLEDLIPQRLRRRHVALRGQYFASPHTRPMGVGLALFGVRKDGSEFPIDISLRPLLFKGQLYTLASIRDDTARRTAERERAEIAQRAIERESAAQAQQLRFLTDLVDLSSDAILLRDPISRVIFWNSGAERLYGWSSQEALGRITHILFQTTFPRGQAAVDTSLEQEGRWNGVLSHRRRDGSTIQVESHQALVRDEGGRPLSILEVNRAIAPSSLSSSYTQPQPTSSSEKDTRVSPASLDTLLYDILDALPIAAYVAVGTDARLLYANNVALRFWNAEWPVGQPIREFFQSHEFTVVDAQNHPARPEQLSAIEALRTGTTILHRQETIFRPDGTAYPILVHAISLPNLLLARDPSLQNDADIPASPMVLVLYQDNAVLKNEAEYLKEEFVGVAAHELRTPLTILSGYVQLLQRRFKKDGGTSQLSSQQQDILTKIQLATDRLMELTRDLLDVTRLQAGQIDLQIAPLDIVPLVKRIAHSLQQTTERHQIEVRTSQETILALADSGRLNQVVTNLVENAVKYSPQGGVVEIVLTNDTDQAQPHQAQLSVRDHGIGIPRQQHRLIFGRFIRADNARARDISGTGLGLYLSRELVEKMGGRLWFESEEDVGSTFFMTLPLAESSPQRDPV